MNGHRFGTIRIANRSWNSIIFILCMNLMIVMTIFNGNTYLAGLSFVWFPSVLLLVASLVMRKSLFTRINAYAILLTCSAALSTKLATVELTQSTYINLQFCIISFMFIAGVSLSDRDFRTIIHFYMEFGFLVCGILLFNYIFSIGVQVFSAGNVRVTIQYFGIAKDVNYLSSFILPCFAYNVYRALFAKEKICFAKAGLVFVSVFVAGSRACFLSMLLAAFIIGLKMISDRKHRINKPVIIFLLFVAVIVLYAVVSRSAIFARTTNFENYANNSRLTIWAYALDGFFANPLIGSGVESGSYYSLLGTRWKTHNCFIDILTGQGIIGSVLILLMYINMIRVKKENRAFLAAIMVCFFLPLFFVNGYECATFWMPMTLTKYLSDKCKEHKDILNVI